VETGRNRPRDWMCGIKNWVEENERQRVLIFCRLS
jgi:hypothetical protein